MKIQMKVENINKTIRQGFAEFDRYCHIRNLSESTISNYDYAIHHFDKYYSIDHPIASINKEVLDGYVVYLRENFNLADASLFIRMKNIKAIINYFIKLGYVQPFEMPSIKGVKKVKETYTDAELALLIKRPNIKKCDFSEYRSWVIINYLLSTGNRLSSVTNLKIRDIELSEGVIKLVKTKNKKQQYIPISNTLNQILTEYLRYRKGKGDDYLFCSIYGAQLTKSAITNSIRRYNRRRGVSKTSIHLFRHTFAKKWIMAGGGIFRLQKVLGHSSLDVVKEYVAIYGDDLKKDYAKFNALDQVYQPKEYIGMGK